MTRRKGLLNPRKEEPTVLRIKDAWYGGESQLVDIKVTSSGLKVLGIPILLDEGITVCRTGLLDEDTLLAFFTQEEAERYDLYNPDLIECAAALMSFHRVEAYVRWLGGEKFMVVSMRRENEKVVQ